MSSGMTIFRQTGGCLVVRQPFRYFQYKALSRHLSGCNSLHCRDRQHTNQNGQYIRGGLGRINAAYAKQSMYILPSICDLRYNRHSNHSPIQWQHQSKGGLSMNIQYIRAGDYYIPDLSLPEEKRPIGKWGRMHREYLREYQPILQDKLEKPVVWLILLSQN